MDRIEIDPATKDTLKELELSEFLTVSFFVIDEIYKQVQHLVQRSGPEATFSDSEVICLNLVGFFLSYSNVAVTIVDVKTYNNLQR